MEVQIDPIGNAFDFFISWDPVFSRFWEWEFPAAVGADGNLLIEAQAIEPLLMPVCDADDTSPRGSYINFWGATRFFIFRQVGAEVYLELRESDLLLEFEDEFETYLIDNFGGRMSVAAIVSAINSTKTKMEKILLSRRQLVFTKADYYLVAMRAAVWAASIMSSHSEMCRVRVQTQ